MKFFIAGIMQGSKTEKSIHAQSYRDEIKQAILKKFPDADVYDPFEKNKNSLQYGDETGKEIFLRHNQMCRTEIDVLIAFVPEASMGTAIEIWEAWQNGATVIAVSPMTRNWVIRYLSNAVYPDMPALIASMNNWNIQEGKLVGY